MFIGYIGKLLWRVINDYRITALYTKYKSISISYIFSLIVSITWQQHSVSLNRSANDVRVNAIIILLRFILSPLFEYVFILQNYTVSSSFKKSVIFCLSSWIISNLKDI